MRGIGRDRLLPFEGGLCSAVDKLMAEEEGLCSTVGQNERRSKFYLNYLIKSYSKCMLSC